MRPPPELLTAASLATPPIGAAAQLAASAVALELPGRRPALGYEQLLRVQQCQHDLALQHKEAEVAHIRARVDLTEASRPPDAGRVAAVLQTKDEEASLMMAAKHKELELMAGLLQLREQQIEEFRQLCEAQRLEIQQLQRARGAEDATEDGWRGPGAARDEPGRGAPAAADGAARGGPAPEDYALLQREVGRLRSRMVELEAAVDEQHERGAGLARALEAKSERVRSLEEQVRSLHLPAGAWTDADQESAPEGAPGSLDSPPLPVPAGPSGDRRPSPPRLLLPPSQHGHHLHGPSQRDSRPVSPGRAQPSAAAPEERGDVVGVPPWPPASGSAVQADAGRTAGGPDGLWGGASEAAETGRQSQELLREMRRLRQQMGELERLASTRAAGRRAGPPAAGAGQPCGGGVAGQDRLLTSGSSFGGGSSADGPCGPAGAEAADAAGVDLGLRPASQNAFLERARHAAGLTA